MTGSFTDIKVNSWLQEIADACWVSLHYDSPGLDGLGLSEISGGSYKRKNVAFSQPSNRAIWSEQDATWRGLPQGIVTYYGLWDSRDQGTLMAYGQLPTKKIIPPGGGLIIPSGDLAVSFA